MRKVIGIGETILDILFKDSQPTANSFPVARFSMELFHWGVWESM